jgi:hypothetical protein
MRYFNQATVETPRCVLRLFCAMPGISPISTWRDCTSASEMIRMQQLSSTYV